MSMREDKIRFHRIMFDWFKQTVYIKYSVGNVEQGGYEDETEITFELFEELVDTTKLRKVLERKIK